MPDVARAVSGIPRADPGGRVTPRFRHRLIRFRHFCSGSLALASLDLACRNLVPAFPQRSPPRLLTTAACGGLRSAPDCRLLPFPVGQWPRPNNAAPSLQPHYRAFDATTGCSAPAPRFGTLALAVGAACGLSLHARRRDEAQVLTFHTKAWSSFAPPTCRMPLGQYQGISRADPGGRVTPRF